MAMEKATALSCLFVVVAAVAVHVVVAAGIVAEVPKMSKDIWCMPLANCPVSLNLEL